MAEPAAGIRMNDMVFWLLICLAAACAVDDVFDQCADWIEKRWPR